VLRSTSSSNVLASWRSLASWRKAPVKAGRRE
jgi:hypothetical protein